MIRSRQGRGDPILSRRDRPCGAGAICRLLDPDRRCRAGGVRRSGRTGLPPPGRGVLCPVIGGEPELVEGRPAAVRVFVERPPAPKSGSGVQAMGADEIRTRARLEQEPIKPMAASQLNDHRKYSLADPCAARLGNSEHPFHLAGAVVVNGERTAPDGDTILITCDEHRRSGFGHLLDAHSKLELARRQRQQVSTQRRHEFTYVVLQWRFDRNRHIHLFSLPQPSYVSVSSASRCLRDTTTRRRGTVTCGCRIANLT